MKTLFSTIFSGGFPTRAAVGRAAKTAASALTVTLAVASAATGCSPGEKFLRADIPSIELTATDRGEHSITIEASASWMASVPEDAGWLDAKYDTGFPDLLWITTTGNNESLEERSTRITVVSGDGLVLVIPVVQLAMDGRLEVTPATLEPFGPRDATPRTLTVSTALTWEFAVLNGADWLGVVRSKATETEEGSGSILTISATPTRSLDPRRDTLVIYPTKDAFISMADSIAVVQEGIDLVVDSDLFDDNFDVVIPAAGAGVALSVYSRATWRVSAVLPDETPADRVSLDMVEGPADIGNGIPFVVTVTPNTSSEEFIFTLVFDSGGDTYEYICRQQSSPTGQER